MNEQPIIEAYARPSLRSFLVYVAFFVMSLMYFIIADGLLQFLIIQLVIITFFYTINLIHRLKGKPILRIYEDRIEHKFPYQKKYKTYGFSEISNAVIKYEFPELEVVRLEFKDERKPVLIQLTNLSVSVETIYKLIVKRINA